MAGTPGGREAGRLSVRVLPDTSKLAADLKVDLEKIEKKTKLNINTGLDTTKANRDLKELQARVSKAQLGVKVGANTAGAKADVEKFKLEESREKINIAVDISKSALTRTQSLLRGVLGGAAKLGGGALAAGGLGASVTQAVALTSALVQASGAAALIPAALLGASAVIGTIAIGMQGVGDAMKAVASGDAAALQKAMQSLAPSARSFVSEIAKAKPQFTELRTAVQENLFAGLGDAFKSALPVLLPAIKSGLSTVASGLNIFVRGALNDLSTNFNAGLLKTTLDNIGSSITHLTGVTTPLIGAFLQLGATGSSFFPRIADAASKMAAKFGDFINKASETGKLDKWINDALSLFDQLGRIIGNVASVLGSVFSAGAANGAGILNTIEKVTGALSAFLKTSEGKNALNAIFSGASATINALIPIIKALVPVIAAVASQIGPLVQSIGPVLARALTAITPAITDLVAALGPALTNLIVAVLPAIADGIKALGPGITAVLNALSPAFAALGPVLDDVATTLGKSLAQALKTIAPLLGPLVTAFGTLIEALLPILPTIAQLITTLLPPLVSLFTQLVTAIAPLITQLVVSLRPIFPVLAQALVALTQALVPFIAQLVTALLPILPELVATFLQWTKAMIPVIPVIGDMLEAITPLLPNIVKLISLVLSLAARMSPVAQGFKLVAAAGPFMVSALHAVVPAVNGVITVLRSVLGWVGDVAGAIGSLPGKISGVAGKMLTAGKTLIGHLFDGVKDAVKAVGGFAAQVGSDIANAIKSAINKLLSLPWKMPNIKILGHGFGGQTILPALADGATILPQPGGTLAVLGEAGKAETVVDTGMVNKLIANANRMATGSTGKGGGDTSIVINEVTDPVGTAYAVARTIKALAV